MNGDTFCLKRSLEINVEKRKKEGKKEGDLGELVRMGRESQSHHRGFLVAYSHLVSS